MTGLAKGDSRSVSGLLIFRVVVVWWSAVECYPTRGAGWFRFRHVFSDSVSGRPVARQTFTLLSINSLVVLPLELFRLNDETVQNSDDIGQVNMSRTGPMRAWKKWPSKDHHHADARGLNDVSLWNFLPRRPSVSAMYPQYCSTCREISRLFVSVIERYEEYCR